MPTTQKQQRFLLDRLEGIRNSKPTHWDCCKVPDTAAVKLARKQVAAANAIIKAHDRKAETRRKKRNDAIRVTVANIKQVILFGDAKTAISLLNSFEKKTF